MSFTWDYNRGDDMLDVRDIIKRFEELEKEIGETPFQKDDDTWVNGDIDVTLEKQELEDIERLLSDLQSMRGDEQWRGHWYPLTLINEDYTEEYAEDLIKDTDGLPRDLPFYLDNNIDWAGVWSDISVDYSSVTINGKEYFYR